MPSTPVVMPSQPLELSTEQLDGWVVVHATGDLDLSTAPLLLSTVESSADGCAVALDLEAIRFIDSSGLRALLQLRSESSGGVTLVNPSRAVSDLLELTRTSDAFPVASTVGDLHTATD